MPNFEYQDGVMHAERVALPEIAAEYGTPCYVYSRTEISQRWHALDDAFAGYPHLICYAVKANSNLAVLNTLAKLGSGFDIVSGGELQRVIAAGGDVSKVVFSGVAKSDQDIRLALQSGEQGVRCLNIESHSELHRIQAIAKELGVIARVGVRVNPDVDARTHPYIATGMETAKFGLSAAAATSALMDAQQMSHVQVHSLACHIGSQITELSPFADAVAHVSELVSDLQTQGITFEQLDLGGGLGIDYQGETLPTAQEYVSNLLKQLRAQGVDLPVAIEPGRYIVGNAGVLLTRVEYLKRTGSKNFAIVDAGMNDLMRPSLYQAFHRISHVHPDQCATEDWDVVGPVCESADVLGTARPLSLNEGDLLAVESAGAYSFVMASNYNSRPRPPEIMVSGEKTHVIRERETVADLYKGEVLIAE